MLASYGRTYRVRERENPPLLVILGPTGVGKTQIAYLVAKRVKGEIISADSRQVYQEFNIGTVKPPLWMRKEIPHWLVDILSPEKTFSAADFKKRAEEIIEKIYQRGKVSLVVGGTGLYIKVLIDGIFPGPGKNWLLRRWLEERIKREGLSSLWEELKKKDPEASLRIHPHDRVRIVRALEVFYLTGKPISSLQKETIPPLFHPLLVGITAERENLYSWIEKRVDKLIKEGWVEEVRTLLKKGYSPTLPAFQSLGYREIVGYIEGKYTLEEAISLIKRNTRRFAKRQLTWFKKDKRIKWFKREDFPGPEAIAEEIVELWERG